MAKQAGPNEPQDWFQTHVVTELRRLAEWQQATAKSLQDTRIEVAQLKVKAGGWGFIAGCIPVVIMLAIAVLKDRI